MKMKNELMRRRGIINDAPSSVCQAKRYQDQMICAKCGFAWDVSDDERPACK